MKSYIRTVCGDILIDQINNVLIHEHVIWNIIQPNNNILQNPINLENRLQTNYETDLNTENSHQEDINIAIKELKKLKSLGGDLIVDQSTYGIGRNAKALHKISINSGINIVAAAGTYCANYLTKEIQSLSINQLIKRFIDEIKIGIDGTNIKAGIIGEIGCSYPLADIERKALIAAAEASKITSAGISVHPGKNPKSPFEIIDIIESTGADISRVVICHIDRTYPNGEKVEELAKKGVYIEWDFFGIESSRYWLNDIELPIDRDRIKLIKKMFKLGYGNKILISHDICSKTRLHEWGGHGYGHIIRNIIPLMKNYGITNDQIDQLIRINPINLLSVSNIN